MNSWCFSCHPHLLFCHHRVVWMNIKFKILINDLQKVAFCVSFLFHSLSVLFVMILKVKFDNLSLIPSINQIAFEPENFGYASWRWRWRKQRRQREAGEKENKIYIISRSRRMKSFFNLSNETGEESLNLKIINYNMRWMWNIYHIIHFHQQTEA